MDISEARGLARELMDQHGLEDWYLKFDNARKRFGVCRLRYKQIGLSKVLVAMNDEANVKDTILHEIAHALCPPREHHGPIWKQKAAEIGCNPSRCYDNEVVAAPQAPWLGKCPNGHEISRFRKPRNDCSCNKCSGGRYNSAFLVTWTRR